MFRPNRFRQALGVQLANSRITVRIAIVNQNRRWPYEYKWPYDQRRTDWRATALNLALGIVVGDAVTEALDPAVLATRLQLFKVEHDQVFGDALDEVKDGYKNDHWIWSVFPQAAGIPESFEKSSSEKSRKFSILCFDEAVAFLEHPTLGLHYVEIVEAVRAKLKLDSRYSLEEIFGRDAKKVISSLTLFRRAAKVSSVAGQSWAAKEPRLGEPLWTSGTPPTTSNRFKIRDTYRDLTARPPISSRLALIDDCDAILENLKPCDLSQEFDRSMEREFAWRLEDHQPRSYPEGLDEDEGEVEPGSRPWRGDAWCS